MGCGVDRTSGSGYDAVWSRPAPARAQTHPAPRAPPSVFLLSRASRQCASSTFFAWTDALRVLRPRIPTLPGSGLTDPSHEPVVRTDGRHAVIRRPRSQGNHSPPAWAIPQSSAPSESLS